MRYNDNYPSRDAIKAHIEDNTIHGREYVSKSTPKKGQTFDVVFTILDNDGDPVVGAVIDSGLTSGSNKVMISLDKGTPANSTNSVSEIGNAQNFAQYVLTLSTSETNHDLIQITARTTTANAKNTVIILYPE
jgi:hypothetical protein